MVVKPICQITGILLVDEVAGKYAHADLFTFGDVYIVNANAVWLEGGRVFDIKTDRYLAFSSHTNTYFERRSVYVFHGDNEDWRFSLAALEYMGK